MFGLHYLHIITFIIIQKHQQSSLHERLRLIDLQRTFSSQKHNIFLVHSVR